MIRTSRLEASLAGQIAMAELPEPVREFRFHHERAWRFDLAWPRSMVAAEVDGGIWPRRVTRLRGGRIEATQEVGRHVRGRGFENDCQKLNAAQLLGWRVFRFTWNQIASGEAIITLRRALANGS